MGGNVFGWYMPSYLSSIYPSQSELLSRYGIIVGVVGSVAVVLGGVVSSLMSEHATAELWLGAFASLLALLFPARTKTFCLAIYTSTIVFLYSSAPQIIGLALRHYEPGSPAYIEKTRDILAILIPVGYWVAGIGFLVSIKMVKSDIAAGRCADEGNGTYGFSRPISLRRKLAFGGFCLVLAALTVALLVTSLTVTD